MNAAVELDTPLTLTEITHSKHKRRLRQVFSGDNIAKRRLLALIGSKMSPSS